MWILLGVPALAVYQADLARFAPRRRREALRSPGVPVVAPAAGGLTDIVDRAPPSAAGGAVPSGVVRRAA